MGILLRLIFQHYFYCTSTVSASKNHLHMKGILQEWTTLTWNKSWKGFKAYEIKRTIRMQV